MTGFSTDQEQIKVFTRRTIITGGLGLGLFGVIGSRLYQLQVIEQEKYAALAEDNRVNRRLIAPKRGRILDRFGKALADNSENYRVVLIPEQTANDKGKPQIEHTLDRLSRIVPISDVTRARVLKEARRAPKFRPILVAEGLNWETFAQLNILLPDLPGVQPEVGERRSYPYGLDLAHVLGYVSRVSDRDIESFRRKAIDLGQELDPELEETLRLPTFRIGKNGIENALEDQLRGTASARHVEVNAFGREIKELDLTEGVPGRDVVLTLDAEVQAYAMARVEGESAGCAVIDIHTGDVISLVSAPGFDPNPFSVGLTQAQWEGLRDDEYNPLVNKSVAGQYPPGSTFKMATALAALQVGAIHPDQTFHCSGSIWFGGRRWHCWKKEGHGWMDLKKGIKHSCDVYFYEAARATGVDAIAQTARALGLGTDYNFIIPGTKPGLVPDRDWKKAKRGEPWYEGETLNYGIGQGYLLSTPLQLAVMVARLSNGGKGVVPRIVRAVGDRILPPAPARPLGFRSSHLRRVMGGMEAVSNEIGGTAYRSRIEEEGMELAGKTGTAQVRRITKEERLEGVKKNEDLPWRLRDHALFVAYAPVQNPKYAIAVVVEHGGGGSKAAAPIARDIMRFTQQRDPVGKQPYDPLRAALLSNKAERRLVMMDSYGPKGRELSLTDKLFEINWGLVMLLGLIAAIGTAMLYSVESGAWKPYAQAHTVRFFVGLGLMVCISLVDIRVWFTLAYPAFALAFLLLIGVEVMGHTGMGATRWIRIGPLNIQPSEIMKITLVLALARYLHGRPFERINHPFILVPALLLIFAPVFLVLRQPDLGTSLLLAAGGMTLLFLAGLSWWYIVVGALAGVASLVPAWNMLHDYQKQRVLTFLDPSRDPLGAGYHITQSKIGFGAGGLTGKGFLESSQARLDFLPEKQTDFIFTILGEEFGLVGALTLIGLYCAVLFHGGTIALSSRSHFGRLVAMGVCTTFLLYVLINTAMVIGLIPVVGVPLPLVSYGGTAMLTIMIGMGLLMSVHLHRHVELSKGVGH